jgi:carbon-monoxide dehydrogenase small subunit
VSRELTIGVRVNGRRSVRSVSVRRTAADFLREDLELRGTHLGCEHGVCGACTILMDGVTVRSCILYAVQLDGADVTTIEGLAGPDGALHPIQEAFRDRHALQCGFCTPGFVLSVYELLKETSGASEAAIREALAGNLCRCTGYQGIVEAVRQADRTWDRGPVRRE